MAEWTIYEAKEHLQAWLEADLALATGKEYTIGNRRLTRANVQEVKDRINFWRNEVARSRIDLDVVHIVSFRGIYE